MLESQKNDKCSLHIFWGTIILNRKEQYFKSLLQPSCHIVRKIDAWIYLAFPRLVLRVEGLLLASITEAQTCLSSVIGENTAPSLPWAVPKQYPLRASSADFSWSPWYNSDKWETRRVWCSNWEEVSQKEILSLSSVQCPVWMWWLGLLVPSSLKPKQGDKTQGTARPNNFWRKKLWLSYLLIIGRINLVIIKVILGWIFL